MFVNLKHHCYHQTFQDCGHKDTQAVIESYGDQIIFIQQPGVCQISLSTNLELKLPKATILELTIPFTDLSEPVIPPKEKKFKGYFKIARHYGWALNKTFVDMGFDQVWFLSRIILESTISYFQVIVVEDDLEISPDFFEYFSATLPLLKQDKSLWWDAQSSSWHHHSIHYDFHLEVSDCPEWQYMTLYFLQNQVILSRCVSAWNDNGKAGLINETAPELLYRTDFFGGLGWMLTKWDTWQIRTQMIWREYGGSPNVMIFKLMLSNPQGAVDGADGEMAS